jgi:carboxylate-amine ligase
MAVAALTLAMEAQLAADYDEGRRLPVLTTHEVEENFWRAIRHGLDGRLVDFNTRRELPAGDAIREIIDYSTGAQEQLGLGRHMAQVENLLKNGNGALRQIRAYEASGDITAAFREAVSRTRAMAGEDTGASNTDI